MKRITLSLAAFALVTAVGASSASAQGRFDRYGYHPPKTTKVDVQQEGRNNGAAVSQKGGVNAAAIVQRGLDNIGITSQTGTGNDATIRQLGRSNDASITQNGNNNAACIVQIGKNLSTDIVQEGDYQNRGVIQTKKGTYEIPAQLCSLDPGSRGYWQRLGFKGY
jgi:minor curlin subunit